MAKGPSEALVRRALTELETDEVMFTFKPPDDARNRKPCDFMVWIRQPTRGPVTFAHPARLVTDSVWLEVKECPAYDAFPYDEIRPAQRLGIETARRLALPYWLVVQWTHRDRRCWTISDAQRVLEAEERARANPSVGNRPTSITFGRLRDLGIDSPTSMLGSNLRAAFEGEL